MNTRLVRFFTLFMLIASGTCGVLKNTTAHDFPPIDPPQADTLVHCFPTDHDRKWVGCSEHEFTNQLAMPLISSPVALYQSYHLLLRDTTRPSAMLSRLYRRVESALNAPKQITENQPQIAVDSWPVARPDAGAPPRPQPRALEPRTYVKKPFLEDYTPYDLCTRDWRLGTAGWYTKQSGRLARPHVAAEVEDPSDFAPPLSPYEAMEIAETLEVVALGGLLQQVENIQCEVSNWLYDPTSLQVWTIEAMDRVHVANEQLVDQLAHHWPSSLTPMPARRPFFTEPQFVLYETTDGKSILLPADQAEQFYSPKALAGQQPIEMDASRFEAVGLVDQTITPIKDQLISQLSHRLEAAGNAMLLLSRCVDQLSSKEIAQRESRDIR